MAALVSSVATPNRLLRQQSSALRRHLQHCRDARGRWFEAAVIAERAHGLMAPRLFTTVVVLATALLLACGWA